MSSRRIGILGGTFDPVHTGHLIIASEAMRQAELDEVVFVPAGRPPHKPNAVLSSNSDRLEMLQIAIEQRPEFSISDVDLRRPGPNYSADLLDVFRTEHPAAQLFFIIGADSLRDFHTWREPHRIVEHACLIVAPRPGVAIDLAQATERTPQLDGRVQVVSMPLIEISSTEIRKRSRHGESYWYQVPLDVEKYIERHRLYEGSDWSS